MPRALPPLSQVWHGPHLGGQVRGRRGQAVPLGRPVEVVHHALVPREGRHGDPRVHAEDRQGGLGDVAADHRQQVAAVAKGHRQRTPGVAPQRVQRAVGELARLPRLPARPGEAAPALEAHHARRGLSRGVPDAGDGRSQLPGRGALQPGEPSQLTQPHDLRRHPQGRHAPRVTAHVPAPPRSSGDAGAHALRGREVAKPVSGGRGRRWPRRPAMPLAPNLGGVVHDRHGPVTRLGSHGDAEGCEKLESREGPRPRVHAPRPRLERLPHGVLVPPATLAPSIGIKLHALLPLQELLLRRATTGGAHHLTGGSQPPRGRQPFRPSPRAL